MSNAMIDFGYVRPRSVAEAAKLLADEPEAKVLAGGQSLIPILKQRLARPSLLVDVQALDAMRGIEIDDSHVRLGAFTRHAEVAANARIAEALPALAHMARGIAHPQVRHMGTIGGSLAHNDPGADYPAAVLGLGATIVTDRRRIAADEFFTGAVIGSPATVAARLAALAQDTQASELMLSTLLPSLADRTRSLELIAAALLG